MIDRIVYINKREAVITFTDHPSLRLYDSSGQVLNFAAWFLTATPLQPAEYARAVICQEESTCPCIILDAA